MTTTPNNIKITKLPIRLGQFLKLANIVQDGFEAKLRIQNGEVLLNNNVETRRGKQLHDKDIITFEGENWIVDVVA